MASRHLARSVAMQTLYEWDFLASQDKKLDEIIERNTIEFAPGLEDRKFVDSLIENVLEKKDEIDAVIKSAAPEWPIEKIAVVDRNVLRIGLYELLFGNYKDVPPKVAINEAIELAKTFGGENSGRFVNGVLGTVYRELGEPGKNQSSKKLNPEELENLPEEKRGGMIVTKDGRVALVHDVFGYWTLPKGRMAETESDEEGAKNAVMRELGLTNITIDKKITENSYVAHDPEKGALKRRVIYFAGTTTDEELHLKASGGLDDAKWFPLEDIQKLHMYDDIKEIFGKL